MKAVLVLCAVVACSVPLVNAMFNWDSTSSRSSYPAVNPELAYNALRQHRVNRIAERLGAGTGTARYYGVPGVDDKRYAGAYGPYVNAPYSYGPTYGNVGYGIGPGPRAVPYAIY